MSDLHDLMTRAAQEVGEPTWPSAGELRATGRHRTRQRRGASAVAGLTAIAVGLALWMNPPTHHTASPQPVAPVTGECLTITPTPGRVASPYSVLIGGRQILRVDLGNGSSSAVTSCGHQWQQVIPVVGARVLWNRSGTTSQAISFDGPAGSVTIPVDPQDRETLPYQAANGDLLVLRNGGAGRPPQVKSQIETYAADGHLTSTTVIADGDSLFMASTVGGLLVLEHPGPSTDDKPERYALVDPRTGAVTATLFAAAEVIRADARRIAWMKDDDLARHEIGGGSVIPQCNGDCPDLQVTDLATRATRTYSLPHAGGVFTQGSFSPDGSLLALSVPVSLTGDRQTTVTILDLRSGSVVGSVPGIGALEGAPNEHPPSWLDQPAAMSWTPDSKALVLGDFSASRLQLRVWHRDGSRTTQAVTLSGDLDGTSFQVIGPSLAAWQ